MANELTTGSNPVADFQKKIIEKLRADIGELLPDEVLADLVKQAVAQSFFEPITVQDGYHTRKEPSWFIKEVTKAAEPMMREAVQKFVADNAEVMNKALAEYLTSANLTLLIVSQMQISMSGQIMQAVADILNQLRRGY